jgi:hypothetical protein
MKTRMLLLVTALVSWGCDSNNEPVDFDPLVVNSVDDLESPPQGTVTLRSALATAESGQAITFDASLDGETIELDIVGDAHSVLRGEVMGIREEPSGPVSYLVGYLERDYGRSALYANKDVVIDASALPNGVTFEWTGDEDARVLGVYGDLTMTNVAVTGGSSVTEDISATNEEQPWTLARGAAVCVWGVARLVDCTLYDNHCVGDFESSRDRGAFGGGLYANIVDLEDCVIAGNTVLGGGAAGGGVYSVGGAGVFQTTSVLRRCAITGNHIAALFAYGAGVYSDGGGIGNAKMLKLHNCTVARNVVAPAPGLPPPVLARGYWRAGGVYMSNGSLEIKGCTIVENETSGYPRTDSNDRRNLAGGIAATVGNAHAVEDLIIGHSIVAGNLVHELGPDGTPADTYNHDIFTGTLFYFRSMGHNRIGVLDFSQILVPVGEAGWRSLCRKHFPKQDDESGVDLGDVLDVPGGIAHHASILSAGTDAGEPTVLSYEPTGSALDRIDTATYSVTEIEAEYELEPDGINDFLEIMLARIEDHFDLPGFAADFTASFESYLNTVDTDEETPGNQPHLDPDDNPILTLADTDWFGPKDTWPKELPNYAYINFWHQLDAALMAEGIAGMGPEILGDDAWDAMFNSGQLAENPDIDMLVRERVRVYDGLLDVDQRGAARPADNLGDIGAVEVDD